MNHLILGAVFWVTGESGGTDGRLALAGTWPPAAGRNERTVISLDAGQEIDTLRIRTHTHTNTEQYVRWPIKHHKPTWKHATYGKNTMVFIQMYRVRGFMDKLGNWGYKHNFMVR